MHHPPTDKCVDGLITPHGDRKRGESSIDRSAGAQPHYPSWGSETFALRGRSRDASWGLITPHGDRKPRGYVLPIPAGGELITPHGDRKLFVNRGWRNAAHNSLPLMGIGNRRCPLPAHWSHPLITPHGDRKQQMDAARKRQGPPPLITPHGDRKRIRQGRSAEAQCSLPLMGIGNDVSKGSPPHASGCPHYPSWGSETRRPDRQRVVMDLVRLITPHGDRKRWYGSRVCASGRISSLPLMGIGNPPVTYRNPWSFINSLPLMGIGNLAADRRLQDCVDQHSLPLMGIGNRVASMLRTRHEPHSLPLMGIGNPHAAQRSPPSPAPHYPSWGSETCTPATISSSIESGSLPLMGIGNRSCSIRSTAPSRTLITPHGDRKPRFCSWFAASSNLLITPHGDRKPNALDRAVPVPGRAHYPSWGSETSYEPMVRLAGAASSLPLMGIGNRSEATASRPRRYALITPHGDRKPRAIGAGPRPDPDSLPLMGIGNLASGSPASSPTRSPHYPSWGSETRRHHILSRSP